MVLRHIRASVPTLAFLAAVLMPAAGAAQERQSLDAERRIADRILRELVAANGVPGMAAAIAFEGELIWIGSAGWRDVERALPVEDDTIFRLASVSKLITATAAAQLYERGVLDIDKPVQEIVPYAPAGWAPITARQLAAHISGIPHYQAIDAARGARRFGSTEEAVGVFSDRPLLFEPGSDYNYSSYGYTLLSAVVEESAGAPFLEYVAEHVSSDLAIAPDGLLFGDPKASKAYEINAAGAVPAPAHDYSYCWGGAGLSASAPRLALFGGRILTGDIVSKHTLEMMLTPARLNHGEAVADRDYTVGFGWRLSENHDGAPVAHHAGLAIGARSALALLPEQGYSAAVLSNAQWTAAIEQTALILILPFRLNNVKFGKAASCPKDAAQYEGSFDGVAIAGEVAFRLENDICIGVMSVDNALGDWLNGYPQRDAARLTIVALKTGGDIARSALITPIGAFYMQADALGHAAVKIGRSRELSIRWK